MEPVVIPEGAACRCVPRNAQCIQTYTRLVVTMVLMITGIIGVMFGIGDEGDKCSFWSLITAVLGYWIGAATSLPFSTPGQQQPNTSNDVEPQAAQASRDRERE